MSRQSSKKKIIRRTTSQQHFTRASPHTPETRQQQQEQHALQHHCIDNNYDTQSQIEVTRMFVSATDSFTSKLGMSSHLNLKKLTSSNCVYDHSVLLLNTHTDIFLTDLFGLIKSDDNSILGRSVENMNLV